MAAGERILNLDQGEARLLVERLERQVALKENERIQARVDLEMRRYFDVADREDLTDEEKLEAYLAIADEYFETKEYWAWCDRHLSHLDRAVLEWVQSDAFDKLLRTTVVTTYPAHERDRFMAHFGGLIGMWVRDEQTRLQVAEEAR